MLNLIDRFRRRRLEQLDLAIENSWSAAAYAGDNGDEQVSKQYCERAQQLEKKRDRVRTKLSGTMTPAIQPNR